MLNIINDHLARIEQGEANCGPFNHFAYDNGDENILDALAKANSDYQIFAHEGITYYITDRYVFSAQDDDYIYQTKR